MTSDFDDNSCSSQGYIEYVNEQAGIYGGDPQITINCNAINQICNNCGEEEGQPTVEACINSFNPTTSSSIQYTSETGIPANQGSAFEICKNVILENSS